MAQQLKVGLGLQYKKAPFVPVLRAFFVSHRVWARCCDLSSLNTVVVASGASSGAIGVFVFF